MTKKQLTSTQFEQLTKTKLVEYLNSVTVLELHKWKRYYDDLYYNTGNTPLDDYRYDMLKDILIERDSDYILTIGAKLRENEVEVILPYYLGSMNKVKPHEEKILSKWLIDNASDEYVIMDKLDGISCLLCSKDGNSVNLYTRADGKTGKDISYIQSFINYIPKNIPKDMYIRGELVMSKINFEKLPGGKVNPRNTVSGAVKAKTVRQALYSVDFVAYEMIETSIEQKNLSKQLDFLDDLGFRTVRREVINKIDMSVLSSKLDEYRKTGHYEIDGLILQRDTSYIRNTDKNPKYSIAFKKDELAEAEVNDVVWGITRRGFLKPVVHIKPIKLCGATISKVTAYNAWFIEENKIGPGAKIEIVRSGDVIPKIIDVIEECHDGAKMPMDEYEWSDAHIDAIALNPGKVKRVKIITHFMSTMKIKHVSEATVNRLYDAGYKNIPDILAMKQSDFEKIDRFGKKLSERTYNSIHESLVNVDLATLMAASNCFELGIGIKRMRSILTEIPDIMQRTESIECTNLNNEDVKKLYKDIMNIEGFSDKMTEKVLFGIPKFREFLKLTKKYITITESNENINTNIPQIFEGKKIVCSGFRGTLDDKIVSRGGELSGAVSKKTFCVIVKDYEDKQSGKVKKAESYGIPVYTIEEFVSNYID